MWQLLHVGTSRKLGSVPSYKAKDITHTHARTHMHKHTHTVHTSHQAISQIHTTQRQTHIPQIAASQKHTPYQRHTHTTQTYTYHANTPHARHATDTYTTHTTHTTHTHAHHIYICIPYTKHAMHHTQTHMRDTHVQSRAWKSKVLQADSPWAGRSLPRPRLVPCRAQPGKQQHRHLREGTFHREPPSSWSPVCPQPLQDAL